MPSTPNGYDQAWVTAINNALHDRSSKARISDLTDDCWNAFLGPLIDKIQYDWEAHRSGEFAEYQAGEPAA